jgi:thiamine pyrophosphate-dependent acetolactate synthase large subunit-like protein
VSHGRDVSGPDDGTMANAVPQAIGVQAAHPDRQVVALSADGGLAMLLGELLTLRQPRSHMSTTMSVSGRAQQMRTWPSSGGSSGSGK